MYIFIFFIFIYGKKKLFTYLKNTTKGFARRNPDLTVESFNTAFMYASAGGQKS